jgi:ribosome-associated heat shock protein Hsp15
VERRRLANPVRLRQAVLVGEPLESVRIDKWLWAARMFKTRSLATAACNAGHVKLDGDSIKPSRVVRRGDHLEVLTPGGERILDVVELAERRGPASVARTLYDDKTPPPPPKEETVAVVERERGMGRPSKRDRRQLRRLRGRD